MTDILIRSARVEEFDSVLPELAFKAYKDRFFDEESVRKSGEKILELEGFRLPSGEIQTEEFLEYSGSLSIPFSCLRPQSSGAGQSFESFQRYWYEKKSDDNFRVFVAEIEGQIIGFVKGDFKEINYSVDFPECNFPIEKEKIFSLGSLYIDPESRRNGVGMKLVKKYVEAMLFEKPECRGMVTDCYWRNNSQYFFNKLGAKSIGFCNISDRYLDGKLRTKTQDIAGEVMFWDRQNLDSLLEIELVSGRKICDVAYSRKTLGYSVMTVAKGNIVDFIEILRENKTTKQENLMIKD